MNNNNGIDFGQVLAIINANSDPAAALESFVKQEGQAAVEHHRINVCRQVA